MGILDGLSDAYSGLLGGVNNFYQNDGLAGLLGMTSVNRQIHDATQAQMNAPNVRAGVAAAVENPMTMAVGPATIRAYHGSPYSFDKFDLSKIGTGEGAQAYGHGLYFAENEGVAKSYRDNLGGRAFTWEGSPAPPGDVTERIYRALGGDLGAAVASDGLLRGVTNKSDLLARADRLGLTERLAPILQKIDDVRPGGSMYEVNLHADPAALLDWDKPLAQQPAKIRTAVADAYIPQRASDPLLSELFGAGPVPNEYLGLFDKSSGAQAYSTLAQKLGGERFAQQFPGIRNGVNGIGMAKAPEAASQSLLDAGIPGIKYLDGGSRGSGTGTSNYVMFDPSLVEILRKYGIAGGLLGGSQATGLLGDAQ